VAWKKQQDWEKIFLFYLEKTQVELRTGFFDILLIPIPICLSATMMEMKSLK